jgi:hypothetical protein
LPDRSDILDYPSLDAGRDLIGEKAARLRDYNQGPSFDKDSAVRVEMSEFATEEGEDVSQAMAVNDAYKATAMQDTFQSM